MVLEVAVSTLHVGSSVVLVTCLLTRSKLQHIDDPFRMVGMQSEAVLMSHKTEGKKSKSVAESCYWCTAILRGTPFFVCFLLDPKC